MGVRDELIAARAITDGISGRVFAHSFVSDLHGFLERLGDSRLRSCIESGGDRQASQQEMAAVVYRIRRAIENIEAWHRHFAG